MEDDEEEEEQRIPIERQRGRAGVALVEALDFMSVEGRRTTRRVAAAIGGK